MKYLLDTNILLRLVEIAHKHHSAASEALKKLKKQNAEFYILLQNISEFWNVCTRPKDKNGLGLSISETDLQLQRFERFFKILPDTTEVYQNWRELFVKHSVSGVQFHNAKVFALVKVFIIFSLRSSYTKSFCLKYMLEIKPL